MIDMPESIKEIFNELKNQVIWVHTKWENYRQLFGTTDKRLKLLSECAHTFFLITHNALIVDVLVSLSRLTDPAEDARGNKNLSFEQLKKQVEDDGDRELASRLGQILGELKEKFAGIRTRRNKLLAHYDLNIALKKVKLDNTSVKTIEEVLALAGDYMNAIEGHYCPTEILYEDGISSHSDGEALVTILKSGLRFRELLKADKIPHEEMFKGEWSGA
jgi:hypothetical protein